MQENIRWGVRYLRVYERKKYKKWKNKNIYIYKNFVSFMRDKNELMSLNQQSRQPDTKWAWTHELKGSIFLDKRYIKIYRQKWWSTKIHDNHPAICGSQSLQLVNFFISPDAFMTQKGKQMVSKRTSIVKLWPIWPLKGELAWFTVIRGYGKKSNDAVEIWAS